MSGSKGWSELEAQCRHTPSCVQRPGKIWFGRGLSSLSWKAASRVIECYLAQWDILFGSKEVNVKRATAQMDLACGQSWRKELMAFCQFLFSIVVDLLGIYDV